MTSLLAWNWYIWKSIWFLQ